MVEEKTGEILGWYNDEEVVLCPKCFAKKHQHHDVAWSPIKKEDKEEVSDVCDECGSRL